MNKILDGKIVSAKIKNQLKEKISVWDIKPQLAVISVSNDPASKIYVRSKEKACGEVGILFKHYHFDITTNEEIINLIISLNNDVSVSAILVQLPLPSYLDKDTIINTIMKNKDVDGLTTDNMGSLFGGKRNLVPCTPLGIMKLLEYYKVNLLEKHVVIVGKSNLVGKPLIELCLAEGATVTVCHSKTNNLEYFTRQADIVIVAVGKKELVKASMLKERALVIDVGITRENKNIYGDFVNDIDKDIIFTPVPGGIGPMTIAALLLNIVKCYENK